MTRLLLPYLAEGGWDGRSRAVREVKVLISWAARRHITIRLSPHRGSDIYHAFSADSPPPRPGRPDLITLYADRRRSPRVYRDLILHELGHYVAFYDPGLRQRLHLSPYDMNPSKGRRWARISVVKEEMIAWDIGAWIAGSLGIPLDRWFWGRRTRNIEGYMKWALRGR